MSKGVIIALIAIICAASFIALGYANYATYTSGNNNIGNDYVTLTMVDEQGNSVPNGVMFSYQQDYDTFTDKDNNTIYRLNTTTDKIKLNSSTYRLSINDNRNGDRSYAVTASMSVPELFEDDAKEDECNFVLELRGNEKTYRAIMTSGTVQFIDTAGIDDSIAVGQYSFDVYLQMVSSPNQQNGSLMSIPVDKGNFVDEFSKTDIQITFRAQPESS